MSSTVPTTLGITQVPEAPVFSTPLALHRLPLSPGRPLLPPVWSLSSLASLSSSPLAPTSTTTPFHSPHNTPPHLPTPASPLSTQTPSNPPPLILTPTWSTHHHHLLLSPLWKHFAPPPSSILNNSEKKLPPTSSVSLKLSLMPSFPRSPKTAGHTSSLPVISLTTSRLRTFLSRTSPYLLSKHQLPPLLPPPSHHPLLSLSQYFTRRSTSPPLNTSLPPCLASLPTATLISTQSTTSRTATFGFHQRTCQ